MEVANGSSFLPCPSRHIVMTDLNCGCAEGVAVYKDIPFMTSSGPVTSSLQNGKVS